MNAVTALARTENPENCMNQGDLGASTMIYKNLSITKHIANSRGPKFLPFAIALSNV